MARVGLRTDIERHLGVHKQALPLDDICFNSSFRLLGKLVQLRHSPRLDCLTSNTGLCITVHQLSGNALLL